MNFDYFINSEEALFHYTTRKIFFEKINPSQKLRLSPIGNMDDPKENSGADFSYHLYGYSKTNSTPARKLFKKMILQDHKVACFCSNNENQSKGYLRSRMWSQYAERHKGVCIVFSKKKIEEKLDNTYKFEKVLYERKIPLETDFKYSEITGRLLKSTLETYIKNNYKKLFFTKSDDYADECEYRLLKRVSDNDNIYEYLDINNCLIGLILGNDFKSVYSPLIDKLKDQNNLEVKQSYYDSYVGTLRIMDF